MGRFDALTQLEEKPQKPTPSPATPFLVVKNEQNPVTVVQNEAEKKPAKPQTRLPAKQPPALDPLERPEKYTTRLEPSLIKKSPSGDLTFDGVQNTYLISPVLGSYASP